MQTRDLALMPPARGTCPTCAGQHDPEQPHRPDSLYYQVAFQRAHGRWPTWVDALAHCDERTREAWLYELRALAIDTGE